MRESSYSPSTWGDMTIDAFKWWPGRPLPFADLASLAGDPTYGNGVFTGGTSKPGEFVRLGDGSIAYYDGAVWKVGAAPEAPVIINPVTPCESPGDFTVSEVKDYVDASGCNGCAEMALESELENKNRARLVGWLEGFIEACDGPDEDEA